MTRITESQLVLPALYLMSKTVLGYISTSKLIEQLTSVMHPSGIDAEILSGRNDTYFSQKVRNLKSHYTLAKQKLASNSTFVNIFFSKYLYNTKARKQVRK